MPAITPDQVHEFWSSAFIAHDLPGLLALYEPDAVLAPSPDERFEGHGAIRETLEGFLALRPTFRMSRARVVQAGDLAVLFSQWHLVGTGPDGNEVRMAGVTSDIVRRQKDGSWLMVIDNPFGGSHSLSEDPAT
jgi:uncharacterized protein (TIGR02246 family)